MSIEERCAELKQKMSDRRTKPYSTHVQHDGYDVVTDYSAPPRQILGRYILVTETGERVQLPFPNDSEIA
ncbi:hypothetical protein FACS18949_07670 [Clostridia bacterium]|nr:hypothetical protein FACS18949_07670 [Clostridia bacterium]